jgi:P-type Cu+ transporter
MHREFDPTDNPFRPKSHLPLYLFTAVVGLLLAADLWPLLAGWINSPALPSWPRTHFGFASAFALLAAVLGGARALFRSLEKLGEWKVGADLAVAIACIAAIVMGEPLVAAEVVFIGLAGECLEAVTFDRTQKALGKLSELFPQRCWVLRDGIEVRVPTTEVVVGDRVVIKPGGKIPVDGVVTDGRSAVDTSALTGESIPVERGPGDTVLAGSVVQTGSLTVDAKRVSTETVAGRVIDLTGRALKEKSAGERLADKLARYFLPVVLGLALLAFAVNVGIALAGSTEAKKVTLAAAVRVALYPTLAVLVVACPCPLVLATPAAVIAALGRLAGTGVLVKSGAALERLAAVTAFAFDKTGTLTEGRLELGDVLPLTGTPEELLRTAAIAEGKSEHPIARVITSAVTTPLPTVDEFAATPGGGVRAVAEGAVILVGTRRLMTDNGVSVPDSADALLVQLDRTGQTSLLVARDGQLLGAIGARDRVRPEAAGVLSELQALGVSRLSLLTGDRASVASAVAADLPLTETRAELLPADKAQAVASGQGPVSSQNNLPAASLVTGHRSLDTATAFVGDGVNDAPALATAAVGIAIGSGTDIAAAAGDVVMMGDPLRPLPLLLRLSREMVRVIRQNVIWFGFGVNLVGVLLTGFLWPLFARADWLDKAPLAGVLYHQLGSVLVLVNSMRLLAFERTGPNTLLGRVRGRLGRFDRWVNTVHAHDLFDWLGKRRRAIARTLLAVTAAAWLASGFVVIAADEVGVCQRFGAVEPTLEPGLHYRLPWPADNVTRVKPAEVKTVEVGFRLLPPDQAKQLEQAKAEQQKLRRPGEGSLSWSSSHADSASRLTDESLLLTGDGSLVEVLATVRYTIADPVAFVLGVQDVTPILRSAAESVLRELAAARSFEELLGLGRQGVERLAFAKLTDRVQESSASGLGVKLEGITVHDLHPPQDVVAAYHAVAEAIQKRDRTVNEATAEASRVVSRAADEKVRVVAVANADAFKKVADATATRDVFDRWKAARTTLTPDEEKWANGDSAKRDQLLGVKRFLTELRLSLEASVAALKGRDKILIDADKLPGTRKLFLLDPDLMPKTPPLAFPRGGPADQRDPP